MDFISLKDAVSHIVDNRGKTCPTSDSGMPLIATNCVKSSSLYPTKEKIRYVDAETYETWFRGHPEPGDILFVNKGSPGEVCLVPDPVDFCIAQDMVSLRANEKRIDPSYLFAVLRDRGTKVAIENMHVGTMIPHFKKTDFDKLNLPLPSRSDQEFIGQLYLGLSKRIALNQNMNQTLEDIAKAIFKSWFVDFDPVRAKVEGRPTGLPPEIGGLFPDEMVDSEIGEIPTGWDIRGLDHYLLLQRGFDLPSKDRIEGDFPVVAASGISSTHNFPKAKAPGVVTGRSGVLGNVFFVQQDFFPLNTTLWVKEFYAATPVFAYFLLRTIDFAVFNAGSAVPTLNRNHLSSLRFPSPQQKLIDQFTKITTPLMESLDLRTKESSTLEQIRDTLLPKLISGELRIPDAEKFLEEAGI